MKKPKLQGPGPKRKWRFGAAIWFGNPPFITQKISRSGSLRWRADHRAKQPHPGQILSASLRLCVEIDALKTVEVAVMIPALSLDLLACFLLFDAMQNNLLHETTAIKRVAHGIGHFHELLVSQRADWWHRAHRQKR